MEEIKFTDAGSNLHRKEGVLNFMDAKDLKQKNKPVKIRYQLKLYNIERKTMEETSISEEVAYLEKGLSILKSLLDEKSDNIKSKKDKQEAVLEELLILQIGVYSVINVAAEYHDAYRSKYRCEFCTYRDHSYGGSQHYCEKLERHNVAFQSKCKYFEIHPADECIFNQKNKQTDPLIV